MKLRYFSTILFTLVISEMVVAGGPDQIPNILSIKNKSFNLNVNVHLNMEFYKEFKLDKDRLSANEITINDNTERWFRFTPIDHDSLSTSKGYYSKVWSPDNKYLVLPLGRFEGFAIYSSKYIQTNMAGLIHKQYYGAELVPEKTLEVISEFGPELWHEFEKWEDANTFVINVGRGNDMKQFRYNIQKNTLSGYKFWSARVTKTQTIKPEEAK